MLNVAIKIVELTIEDQGLQHHQDAKKVESIIAFLEMARL